MNYIKWFFPFWDILPPPWTPTGDRSIGDPWCELYLDFGEKQIKLSTDQVKCGTIIVNSYMKQNQQESLI